MICNTCASQIEQYIEKIGDISQSFKRWFNIAAPINQLPEELLTRVFEIVQVHRSARFPHRFATIRSHASSGMANTAISWIPRTMHICSYWRAVVLSTPSLWTVMHFMVGDERKHTWRYYPPSSILLPSRSAPLHISIYVITYHRRSLEPKQFYDALRTVTDRTETLQICWEGRFKAGILDVLRCPFPQLTALTLCLEIGNLENSTPAALPATVFGGELHQLRRLSLWFYTYWPHHKFPNLTHISLHNQIVRPSVIEFLDLLESTPSLEFLCLWKAGPRIARGDLLPQRTVSLPALRLAQFISTDDNAWSAVRILECLTIRHSTRCLLWYYDTLLSPSVVENIFTHIIPEGVTELRVYPYDGYPFGLQMDALRISMQATLDNFVTAPAPRFTNIKHLHLVLKYAIPKVDWGGFPNLLSIMCYDSFEGINNLVTSLSEDETEDGCPCPFLEIIYLYAAKQLPDPARLDNLPDRVLVQGVLGRMPERTVVHRNRGNSFQVVLELQAVFPEEFEVEALFTFPKDITGFS
jgi:hypothetical protein